MTGASGRQPVSLTESEKRAAEREARHDVAARGARGGSLTVQRYLSQRREEESRRDQRPPSAPPPTRTASDTAAAGGVVAGQQGPVEDSSGRRPRLVVGVDGSAGSRIALEVALVDAARRGAELEVVTAYAPVTIWSGGLAYEPAQIEVIRGKAEQGVRDLVDEALAGPVAGTPGMTAVDVRVIAIEGHPVRVLLAAAEDADLLVVGSRGRGAVGSALLGSVALHSIGRAPCPVLVVHPAERPEHPPRVLVGFDDSPGSRAALAAGMDEAGRLGADLEVLACYEVGDRWSVHEFVPTATPEPIRDRVQRAAEQAVQEIVAARAGAAGLPRIRIRVELERAADELVASSRGARRLVVGSTGHGMISGLLLGSVALHCAMHAVCPVLVVGPLPESTDTRTARRDPAMAGG